VISSTKSGFPSAFFPRRRARNPGAPARSQGAARPSSPLPPPQGGRAKSACSTAVRPLHLESKGGAWSAAVRGCPSDFSDEKGENSSDVSSSPMQVFQDEDEGSRGPSDGEGPHGFENLPALVLGLKIFSVSPPPASRTIRGKNGKIDSRRASICRVPWRSSHRSGADCRLLRIWKFDPEHLKDRLRYGVD